MTYAPAWQFTPVLSDWEQQRIDTIQEVSELLGADRASIDLPTFTREQLVAAADEARLVDLDDLEWWNDLTDDERIAVVEAGQRSLIAAGHLRVTARGSLEMSPPLQLVVAIRHAPAFLALAGGEDPEGMMMRAYGFAPPSGAPGVLLEARVFLGLNRYLLATGAEGAAALARFLLYPPGPDEPYSLEVAGIGRVIRRRLEAFAPGELVAGQRFEVLASSGESALAEADDDGRLDTPSATTHAQLAARIESVWAGCA